nr:MAG TPA: hypothetical protein [Caudoviricetes sp.]
MRNSKNTGRNIKNLPIFYFIKKGGIFNGRK